jgi:hypothetical protein
MPDSAERSLKEDVKKQEVEKPLSNEWVEDDPFRPLCASKF